MNLPNFACKRKSGTTNQKLRACTPGRCNNDCQTLYTFQQKCINCKTLNLSTVRLQRRPASVRLRPAIATEKFDKHVLVRWLRWHVTDICSNCYFETKNDVQKKWLRLLRWKGGLCIAGTTPTWRTTFLQSHTSCPPTTVGGISS